MLKQEFILTQAMEYHWCFDIWDRFGLKAVVRSKNPMGVKVNYVYAGLIEWLSMDSEK